METFVRPSDRGPAPSATRAGGRGARRAQRAAPNRSMLPSLRRGIPVCEIMDGTGVERIDAASMAILEEVGVVFRDPVALADWRRAGADVRGDRVHLDRGLVRELIATIPATFAYRARNPDRSLPFGGPHSIFVPMTGFAFLRDLDDVRRWPTLADLGMFHKLAHMSPALHSTAHHIVEPMDVVVSHRHLHITYSSMKHSDKTFMGMTTSPRNAEDVMGCARSCSARPHGGDAGRHRQLQRQLAAGLGRGDAGRDARLLPPQPARARRPSCWAGPTPRPRSPPPWPSSTPRRCRRWPTRRWSGRGAPRSTATTSRRSR